MPRKIDFSGFNPSDERKMFLANKNIKETDNRTSSELSDQREKILDIIDLIKQIYPGKILFSIKEVSELINLSYEFIRRQISNGTIKSISFGDRRMIAITELAYILNNGVNNGNTTIN